MENTKKTPSGNVVFFAIVWLITYTACLLLIKKLSPDTTEGLVLSFLPVVTFALFIYKAIRSISLMDEVQVRIQMEAAVIAFSLVLLMIMTLGLLDLVIDLNKDNWSYRHLVPYIAIFYFIGLFISKRKYN